jgi:hypothetical protein
MKLWLRFPFLHLIYRTVIVKRLYRHSIDKLNHFLDFILQKPALHSPLSKPNQGRRIVQACTERSRSVGRFSSDGAFEEEAQEANLVGVVTMLG